MYTHWIKHTTPIAILVEAGHSQVLKRLKIRSNAALPLNVIYNLFKKICILLDWHIQMICSLYLLHPVARHRCLHGAVLRRKNTWMKTGVIIAEVFVTFLSVEHETKNVNWAARIYHTTLSKEPIELRKKENEIWRQQGRQLTMRQQGLETK